jgi:hypothetical protein
VGCNERHSEVRRASGHPPRRGRSAIIHHPLSSINCVVVAVVVVLSLEMMSLATDFPQADPVQGILDVVQGCMTRSPAPWPQAWQQEYVDTIREAIDSGATDPQCAERLRIVREGFGPYWQGLTNNKERPAFDVRRAQIRWYVETLMDASLPGEEEKHALRHQYEDLAECAAQSLLTQFSFLDPNAVQQAKADHLAECYRSIDTPLLPIFLTPFSQAQMDRVKERWHDLRYARVDLWRQLGGGKTTSPVNRDASSIQNHPDYLLTQRSLSQLRGQIWSLIGACPEYYRDAVSKDVAAGKQRLQAGAEARSREQRLGVAVWQTEYLSFLLTALLETAQEQEP